MTLKDDEVYIPDKGIVKTEEYKKTISSEKKMKNHRDKTIEDVQAMFSEFINGKTIRVIGNMPKDWIILSYDIHDYPKNLAVYIKLIATLMFFGALRLTESQYGFPSRLPITREELAEKGLFTSSKEMADAIRATGGACNFFICSQQNLNDMLLVLAKDYDTLTSRVQQSYTVPAKDVDPFEELCDINKKLNDLDSKVKYNEILTTVETKRANLLKELGRFNEYVKEYLLKKKLKEEEEKQKVKEEKEKKEKEKDGTEEYFTF